MNLRDNIDLELWEIIQKNYENESYSSAILDAIHNLTETIRNKTGLEGDGSSLIGQAFGGENPKIKLNKLQTESEKNIQKGTQEILKGMYTAIRNPRSHDKLKDEKEEADAIIYFINYLLKIIDASKLEFEESEFLKRVYDKYYVNNEEYSELLVKQIPKRQRMNIAVSVVLNWEQGDIYVLQSFLKALLRELDEKDIKHVLNVVSDILKYTSDHKTIRTMLNIITGVYWGNIEKSVCMRIENIIKEDVQLGQYSIKQDLCMSNGSLGTWITIEHLKSFGNIEGWTMLLVEKLESSDEYHINYVFKYFWDIMCKLNKENIHFSLEYYIKEALKNNNEKIVDKFKDEIMYEESHPWWEVFKKELKEYPEIKYIEFPF